MEAERRRQEAEHRARRHARQGQHRPRLQQFDELTGGQPGSSYTGAPAPGTLRDDDRVPVHVRYARRSSGAEGPPASAPPPRGRAGRVVKRLLIAVGALVLVAALGLFFLYQYIMSDFREANRPTVTEPPVDVTQATNPDNGETLPVTAPPPSPTPLPTASPFAEGIQNILLIGRDSRNDGQHDLADTIMVLTIDNNSQDLKLASIQRDTLVFIGGDQTRLNRINASMAEGPEMVVHTVNRNFSLDIRNYVSIDMAGTEEIINMLGGIEIDVPENPAFIKLINDGIYEQTVMEHGWGYKEDHGYLEKGGKQLLTGRQALAYMRVRMIDSDYKRAERQREVLQLLLRKFLTRNILDMTNIVKRGLGYVRTNMGEIDLLALATTIVPRFSSDISQMQIPAPGTFWEDNFDSIAPGLGLLNPKIHDFIYGNHDYLQAVPEVPQGPKVVTDIWIEPGTPYFYRIYRGVYGARVEDVAREEIAKHAAHGYIPSPSEMPPAQSQPAVP